MNATTAPRPFFWPLWLRWTLVFAWMGLIFFFSSQSNSGTESLSIVGRLLHLLGWLVAPQTLLFYDHIFRKSAHVTVYAILAGLLYAAVPHAGAKRAPTAWLATALYAASDEWHQSFVPGRGPSLSDVLLDSTAALVALLVIRWACKRSR
jgi:VanZ family protein